MCALGCGDSVSRGQFRGWERIPKLPAKFELQSPNVRVYLRNIRVSKRPAQFLDLHPLIRVRIVPSVSVPKLSICVFAGLFPAKNKFENRAMMDVFFIVHGCLQDVWDIRVDPSLGAALIAPVHH